MGDCVPEAWHEQGPHGEIVHLVTAFAPACARVLACVERSEARRWCVAGWWKTLRERSERAFPKRAKRA